MKNSIKIHSAITDLSSKEIFLITRIQMIKRPELVLLLKLQTEEMKFSSQCIKFTKMPLVMAKLLLVS